MNAPLTREQQINLMRGAAQRLCDRMRVWMSNPQISEALSTPVSDGDDVYETHRTRKSV